MFTDAYLYESRVRVEIELFANRISRLLEQTDCSDLPSGDYDIVLELAPTEDGTSKWCYYFVNHNMHSLFWLHDFDASEMISEVTSISADSPKFSISQIYLLLCVYATLTCRVYRRVCSRVAVLVMVFFRVGMICAVADIMLGCTGRISR